MNDLMYKRANIIRKINRLMNVNRDNKSLTFYIDRLFILNKELKEIEYKILNSVS